VLEWIDRNPWLAALIFFVAGALFGALMRLLRRGKYERRESQEAAA
jgi:uncharacterized membrane-anchored protein YhcB (DUF1043 family)